MLKQQGASSQVVRLKPHHAKLREIKALGLPLQLVVRFVRVMLKTGEAEVLVTSLLDEVQYPTSIFKELYYKRWGIETFYGTLKGRLNLENFSGETAEGISAVEAIQQDFYSTIFISSLESVLTQDAQEQLDQKQEIIPKSGRDLRRIRRKNQHNQQVNKSVSFNAIKANVIELLYNNDDPEVVLKKLTRLFLMKPISCVKNRDVGRKRSSARSLYNYHRRRKKICF